jgi:hypothetical protein
MDSNRDIVMRVREALDYQAAAQAGRNPNERRPLADVLAETIPGELIPGLREMYLTMIAMSAQWQQKGFQAALTDAATNNTLLAGFPASVWMGWGGLLLALLDFLDTPQVGLGGITAKDALLDDYLPQTEAEWAALNVVPEPAPEPEPDPAP